MRKLKLHLDELAVDSFETAPMSRLAGTVRGAADAPGIPDEGDVVEPEPSDVAILSIWTCWTACGQNTCGGSCGVTCATCNDPTCNSCHITMCWTGNSPECCA